MLYYIVMDIMLKGGVVFSMLDVTLVGCGGTIPLKRWLTACMMRYNGSACSLTAARAHKLP